METRKEDNVRASPIRSGVDKGEPRVFNEIQEQNHLLLLQEASQPGHKPLGSIF